MRYITQRKTPASADLHSFLIYDVSKNRSSYKISYQVWIENDTTVNIV